MFDQIDFLSPHSTAAHPLRKSPPRAEVDLVKPAAVPKLYFWKKLLARLRFPPSAPRISPKSASISLHPVTPLRASRSKRWQQLRDNFFHRSSRPTTTGVTEVRIPSAPLPPPPPPFSPPSTPPAPAPIFSVAEKEKKIIAVGKTPSPPPPPPFSPPPAFPHSTLFSKLSSAFHRHKEGVSMATRADEGNGGMLEVNLLPELERTREGYHARVMHAGAILFLLTLAVVGASLGLRVRTNWHENEKQLVMQEIAEVERQMVQNASDLTPIFAFQQRSGVVASLLSQHTHWLAFLSFIEEITSRDVYYDGFNADREGRVKLQAHARDFKTAAEQFVTFTRDSRVKKITISAISTEKGQSEDEHRVTFGIDLELDPVIIMPQSQPHSPQP